MLRAAADGDPRPVPFAFQQLRGSALGTLAAAPRDARLASRFAPAPAPRALMRGRCWLTGAAAPPPLAVTLSRFEDGSAALGVALSHGVADGSAFSALLHAWGAGHSGGCWEHARRFGGAVDRGRLLRAA
eukprot:SAG11_NODE_21950_length_415_cov_0.977848_1_plen_129_part_01